MKLKITEEDRIRFYEEFDTHEILNVIDDLNEIREHMSDSGIRPPQIRDDLLKLHTMAFDMQQGGPITEELYELTEEVSSTMFTVIAAAEKIQETIDELQRLLPDQDW
jgi:hypothetical protein